MSTTINVKCPSCEKTLKVPSNLVGRTGKCPACKSPVKIEAPSIEKAEAKPASQPKPPPVPKPQRELTVPAPPPALDTIPAHAEEIQRDKERFAVALSVAPDKFPIVQPYMMDHESARAIALQRQFPFTLFSDIALLTSHRLMVFRRFFTKVTMVDLNYIDFGDVTIQQGFFTSRLNIRRVDGRVFTIDKLITDQALNLYRHCQDIETKARVARRQFELENNRSRTNQLQINNVTVPQAYQPPGEQINAPSIAYRDISKVGDEVHDPYKLGE